MPEFQFLTTLTVNAPSEAAAQTQADHAIEDADQYLSSDYKLEIAQYQGAKPSSTLFDEGPTQSRYTVELTTEGWQVKDSSRELILADVFSNKRHAESFCDELNLGGDLDAA